MGVPSVWAFPHLERSLRLGVPSVWAVPPFVPRPQGRGILETRAVHVCVRERLILLHNRTDVHGVGLHFRRHPKNACVRVCGCVHVRVCVCARTRVCVSVSVNVL